VSEVNLELRRQLEKLRQSMRVRRPEAPWRMEDDGQGEANQDAGTRLESPSKSAWTVVDIPLFGSRKPVFFGGSGNIFGGQPLKPQDFEDAAAALASSFGQPTQLFLPSALHRSFREAINYPIQSSGSDLILHSGGKIATISGSKVRRRKGED